MSLVTAVPFGLAIRDTVRHPSANEDALDFDGSHARARALAAEQARWEAEERAAQARHEAARAKAIHALYGAAPASLGSVFDGIHLGAPSTEFQPDAARRAIQALESESGIEVAFDTDFAQLRGITVDLGDTCDDLATQLRAAWGASPWATWRAPDGQRAHLDTDACSLTFDRSVDAAAWVDLDKTAVVPLALVGRPASDLDGHVADDSDDTGMSWRGPGLGMGNGGTEVQVDVENAKIVAVSAEVDADPGTIQAVQDRLTTLLHGAPAVDGQVATWKGPPEVTLEVDGNHLRLVAGAQP